MDLHKDLHKDLTKDLPNASMTTHSLSKSSTAPIAPSLVPEFPFNQVLSDIVERDPDASLKPFAFPTSNSGFPRILHRSEFVRKRIPKPKIPETQDPAMHQENMERIAAMKESEIKEAVEELSAKLDPKILEMLKKRSALKYNQSGVKQKRDSIPKKTDANQTPQGTLKPFTMPHAPAPAHAHSHPKPNDPNALHFDKHGLLLKAEEIEEKGPLGTHAHTAHMQKESYTIQDLMMLTRSTSQELKLKSLQLLSKIVWNLKNDNFHSQSEKVEKSLICEDMFLHLRVALDDKMTVCQWALEILSLMIAHSESEERCWEDMFYTRQKQLAVSFSADHQDAFYGRAKGSLWTTAVFEDSFDGIKRLLKRDVIAGLLKTQILDRFRYLLAIPNVSEEVVGHVLEILKVMVKHSKQSANLVVSTAGLVEILLKHSIQPVFEYSVFIILKGIGVASRANMEQLVQLNCLDRVMRTIAMLESSSATPIAWAILCIASRYGLTRTLLDDYRPLMYSKTQEYFSFSNDVVHLKCRIGLLKTLTAFVNMIHLETEMGGSGDELKPFVDILLSFFQWFINFNAIAEDAFKYHMASFTTAIDFLQIYIKSMKATHSTADLCRQVLKHVDGIYALLSSKARDLAMTGIPEISRTNTHGLGLRTDGAIDMAKQLQLQSAGLDFFSSVIDLKNAIQSATGTTATLDSSILNVLETRQYPDMLQSHWIRFFGQGRLGLALALLNYYKETHTSGLDAKSLIRIALIALLDLVPGDEVLASRILHGYIFNPQWRSLLGVPFCEETIRMMSLDIYDRGMYTDTQLEESSFLYGPDCCKITSFMSECALKGLSLPIARDWMYHPFDAFLKEERNGIRPCWDDMKGFILESFNVIDVCRACAFELGPDVGVALVHIMKVFLLSSAEDQELFRDEEIEQRLSQSLDWAMACSHDPIDLEGALDGKGRFYQLYTELLDQYAATSFGNVTFARYMMLPLSMTYPHDFRLAFWTRLESCLGTFSFDERLVPGGMTRYLDPSKDHKDVLEAYMRSLATHRLQHAPILYRIASDHLQEQQQQHL